MPKILVFLSLGMLFKTKFTFWKYIIVNNKLFIFGNLKKSPCAAINVCSLSKPYKRNVSFRTFLKICYDP